MTIEPAVVVAVLGALASGFGVALRLIYNDLQKQIALWQGLYLAQVKARDELLDATERKVAGKRTAGA